MLRRCRSMMVCFHVSMFDFAMNKVCFMIWAYTIIHQPPFPSQLVNISNSYPSYRISWILKHQPETPLDLWFFDCSTRYPTPTVQTPKDGAWGVSYQRSGFIPGPLVQMRQNLKYMESGCGCCCGCWMFLVVVLVVGCWWWWLDVGVVFCLSILFNWNLPSQIILKIIPCTVVMHHHVSLESLFAIIHFHWS